MSLSVCITVFNEEKTIGDLLTSLESQTKKPDEIFIVDGGSKDRTVDVIKHYQKKHKNIEVRVEKCSRARGRNLAVSLCDGDIVAVTDSGCIPNTDWLEKIISPFKDPKIEVVAGFYDMEVSTPLQKVFSLYFGVTPKNFNTNFLPSARSLAFRKMTFEKLSGFPELMSDTAEDSLFAVNVIRQGIKIHRQKNARVLWQMPYTLTDGMKKFFKYAQGDARSGIWVHPVHGFMSHNIKAVLKIARYSILVSFMLVGITSPVFFVAFLILVLAYAYWAFAKTYSAFHDIKLGLMGIGIQFASDVAVMGGFVNGLANK